MTITAHHPAMPPDAGNSALTCEVLISHCDAADFDGDWRYSAFCPDVDAAMDGRSADEALQRLQDAIRIKLADGSGAYLSPTPPVARAATVADFLDDGRLVKQTTLRIERK